MLQHWPSPSSFCYLCHLEARSIIALENAVDGAVNLPMRGDPLHAHLLLVEVRQRSHVYVLAGWLSALRGAVASSARRLDAEDVPRLHREGRLGAKADGAAVALLQQIQPRLAGEAALEAKGPARPPLRQNAHPHRPQKLELPDHAVPAAELAGAAGALAQPKVAQHDGVAALQDLGVRDARVGHVGVHAAAPLPRRPGARAARHRLVVAEAVVAKGGVVHAALAGGRCGERLEDNVRHALARQHVAAHDCGAHGGVEDAALGDDDVDWRQATLVQRDVARDHAAEAVDDGGEGDGGRRVAVAVHLRAGPGEVEHGCLPRPVDRDPQHDGRAVVHLVLRIHAAHLRHAHLQRKVAEHLPHSRLRVVLNVGHVGLHHAQAVLLNEVAHQLDALGVGRHLRLEIRQVVLQVARARVARDVCLPGRHQQLGDALLLEMPVADQLERHNGGALLVQRLAVRRHGAGGDAADVGVVRAAGHVEHNLAALEHWRDDSEVWQVAAARQLRMVRHDHVALRQPFARAGSAPVVRVGRTHRLRHRPEVDRHVGRVRHQAAIRTKKRARKVEPLLDVDGDGGALQRAPHLLRDAHEAMRKDGELDGVALQGVVFVQGRLADGDADVST
mmetsp:Transcript_19855/g.51807  ORF Transcript_19855/g.51807 Transcript_19855/m.51807 type:complete len:618 (-) Transcript_19855:431-2284(-)